MDEAAAREAFGDGIDDATRAVEAGLRDPVRAPGLGARAIEAARSALTGLEKFVQGAVVAPQGDADASSFMPLVRRMAAVGLVSSFAILVPDADARAWDRPVGAGYGQSSIGAAYQAFRQRRREIRREREGTALAAGAGLVGGLLLGGALGGGNALAGGVAPYGGYGGYQPRPAYGGYAPGVPQAPYGGYGGGYGAPYGGERGAYGTRAVVPSDGFTLSAKTLIAAEVGSVQRADAIYDRFINQAMLCIRELGPAAQCMVRFQGVTLDLGRGEFVASAEGVPVVVERGGRMNRLRPDILQRAFAEIAGMGPDNRHGGLGY